MNEPATSVASEARPLLTCFTKEALKHARARGIPARLVPLQQWELEVLAPIRVPPTNPVVQESLAASESAAVLPGKPAVRQGDPASEWTAVPRQDPVVRGVPPPIKERGGTPVSEARAKAHTPFALARSGGTPKPGAPKPKRKAGQSKTGRSSDGPACIGCIYYQALYRNGCLFGYGACKARDEIPVAANNRRACALYEFHGRFAGRWWSSP
jgi:hypothetical protein